MQKHIRGAGLAYGASIEVDEEAGLTSFKVWRSPDAYKAYKAAGDVVRDLADGSVRLDGPIRSPLEFSLTFYDDE